MLEVEFKASLEGIAPESMDRRREELGFQPSSALHETDIYYNGRDRDFRKTDEALRMRSCKQLPDGSTESLLTYKGPKLDQVSSARKEYEVAVSDGEVAEKLLEALGYQPLFTVDKVRREFRLQDVTLCLDEVAGLGRFLELEALVPDGGCREEAEERLLKLLEQLGVSRNRLTRASYLELLMRAKKD